MLLAGARNAGCEVIEPQDYGTGPLAAVHSDRYLEFLGRAHTRWSRIKGAADVVIPNIHPLAHSGTHSDGYPKSVVAQAGFHMADLACPMSEDSWDSICWSAWTAVQAAEELLAGEDRVYALCRPPGHHAFSEIAGGFCFLNNTAIAAQRLRQRFDRIAIIDVDLHHGNGTQGIFYQRDDVFTASIHAHPERFYPFFWGYESETGEGAGTGCNLNLPLARGSGDEAFLAALEQALDATRSFDPGVVVIALGLDAFTGDPFGGLRITTDGFQRIAREISRHTGLPLLMVQEGGYPCKELGENLTHFLKGTETT